MVSAEVSLKEKFSQEKWKNLYSISVQKVMVEFCSICNCRNSVILIFIGGGGGWGWDPLVEVPQNISRFLSMFQ